MYNLESVVLGLCVIKDHDSGKITCDGFSLYTDLNPNRTSMCIKHCVNGIVLIYSTVFLHLKVNTFSFKRSLTYV